MVAYDDGLPSRFLADEIGEMDARLAWPRAGRPASGLKVAVIGHSLSSHESSERTDRVEVFFLVGILSNCM